ncbi:PAS domain-containing sensor histidine kinase [Cellvibrio sp. KY-YJ-3]|uniref:sensor histidine kinase n=1 Tax=Cellvibrio sp. KY-YJ-3 TaxID=454662 RepID=UPI001245AB22|nr:PAS domain-containing sensor histidine kinase [Cellvibrio sp. KY-YJ-3]QEY10982.1 PAS domain-containing sensor histidine kinase [Cellvibrio sp. KY-YJ-3]
MLHAPLASPQGYNPYDLLRIYTYYRTLLGSVLLLMFQIEFAPRILGNDNPQLFFYSSIGYTAINFMTLIVMWRVKYAPSQTKLFSSLLIDVIAISLLMHASGGATSSLGYLLLIAIAAGGIMLRERISFFLAAITTIVVISEGAYRFIILTQDNKAVFTSGTLSALAFLTALLFQHLTKKIRLSYAEAESQAKQAAHLQKLAQLIVERMRTGILVLNNQLTIELHNHAALKLLGITSDTIENIPLSRFPDLYKKHQSWQRNSSDHSPFLKIEGETSNEIKVNFAYLEADKTNEVLIFLEDVRSLNQQAQQLKLASLGRLTASIAHEIRNPLGAISHASQLLAESPQLPQSDARLLDIINNHSTRVNQIIENILQLSRRRPTQTLPINLRQWIPTFINDYKASKTNGPQLEIALLEKNLRNNRNTGNVNSDGALEAKFDTSQLTQVLSNLCDNGLRYSSKKTGRPDLRLEIGVDISQHQPYIRVIDYGPGISDENIKHLFEPFFTTENTGSGLGLYICKELCEANQAIISYKRTPQGESCFHLQLAHPDKAS